MGYWVSRKSSQQELLIERSTTIASSGWNRVDNNVEWELRIFIHRSAPLDMSAELW